MRWLPGVATLREYQRSWLRHDLVAGLVLVDHAGAGGHRLCRGFGRARRSMGCTPRSCRCWPMPCSGPAASSCSDRTRRWRPSSWRWLLPLSGGDPLRAVALAGAMAIVSGLVCILAGVLRLGFVTELFSKPIRYGYMNGIALTVLISQLPKLFGFSVDGEGPLRNLWAIGEAVVGRADELDSVPRSAPPRSRRSCCSSAASACPGVLIAVVGATAGRRRVRSGGKRAGSPVLGSLPQGLPAFAHSVDRLRRPRAGVDRRRARWRSCRSPIPACCRAPTPPGSAATSIPIRRWWAWAPPILPPGSSRAFRSAAVRRARRWPKRRREDAG